MPTPTGDVALEASAMGWLPGQWPRSFDIDGETFVYLSTDYVQGEIQGWRYVSNMRRALIIND